MLDPSLPQGGYNRISSRDKMDVALDNQQQNPQMEQLLQRIRELEARPIYTAGLNVRINGGIIDAFQDAQFQAGGGGTAIVALDLIDVTLCRNGQPWSYSFQGTDNGAA